MTFVEPRFCPSVKPTRAQTALQKRGRTQANILATIIRKTASELSGDVAEMLYCEYDNTGMESSCLKKKI